jgi:hypothetical protein
LSQPPLQQTPSRPRVLLVYYTYTQQTKLVAEAIADVLRDRGCEVRPAAIGFTDKRWAERFSRLPLRHAHRDILGMLPAQLRAATGEIQIPDEAREGNYDLICRRVTNLAFRAERADPLLPDVRGCRATVRWKAVRCVRGLPAVLEHQPEVDTKAWSATRRRVHLRHSLHVRRQPGSVVPVAPELFRKRGEQGALSRHEHPAVRPQAGLPGAGSGVRERAR